MLRARCSFMTRRNYSGCYKLREWIENDSHRYMRKLLGSGWENVVVRKGEKSNIVVPQGYAVECGSLPELEQSAHIEEKDDLGAGRWVQ